MAKKRKKQPVTGHLSPVKYIQTKARQLPVTECLVNADWLETRMANITIVREHSNGNITLASYLVDLMCLGVKDSDFQFNISHSDYEAFKGHLEEFHPMIPIDYTLAHNIIFAAYEFAIELGIEPCKAFIETTRYMLEEDNDDVELIDIECGEHGLPVIIRGEHNAREADETYHRLCNTIGKDKIIIRDIDEQKDWTDDDSLPLEDYIYDNPVKERRADIQKLKVLTGNLPNISEEESLELSEAANHLFYNYHGYEMVEESREEIFNLFDVDIIGELSDRVLGFSREIHPDWVQLIEETIDQLQEDDEVNLEPIIKDYPLIPFLKYIHIKEMEFNAETDNGDEAVIRKQLKKYLKDHPHYFLLKLVDEVYRIKNNEEALIIPDVLNQEKTLSELFNQEEFIHSSELLSFIVALF
ncbi:MAG: hypothetical protein JEZ14_08270, partial [Marinilabiliaceae bacterium]|nr:hypothetical protein [Marinilabiliaceae bacterium]